MMDEEAQVARAQAVLRQLSPDQVTAIHHVVRQQLLADLHDEAIQVARGAVERAWAPHREQIRQELGAEDDARLSTVTQERDEARNDRALAQQLLVSLLRQLLPNHEPVHLFSLGVRELDAYRLNHILAGYGLQLRSRRTASERQVKARVGERAWERRSLFWLERLPVGEDAVPELTRVVPEEPLGQRKGEIMTTGEMWDYQVVELSGMPEEDEATLNPYGLIGYELVTVIPVTAMGRLLAYLKRGTLPENDEAERA
jgi:hypothetical protein